MGRIASEETRAILEARKNGHTLRALAAELCLPENWTGVLSDVLNGREGVSQDTENRLRLALGLPAIGTRTVPVCPACGGDHRVEGNNCEGLPVVKIVALRPGQRIYRRGPARHWRDLAPEELAAAIRHRVNYGEG